MTLPDLASVPVRTLADLPPSARFVPGGIGVEGYARFRSVVDTAGRVEPASVEAIGASHEAFAFAVRSTLPRMRIRPGRVAGQPVRQLVELPFAFRISR